MLGWRYRAVVLSGAVMDGGLNLLLQRFAWHRQRGEAVGSGIALAVGSDWCCSGPGPFVSRWERPGRGVLSPTWARRRAVSERESGLPLWSPAE